MREIKFRAWHHEKGNPLFEPFMTYGSELNMAFFWNGVEREDASVEVMQYLRKPRAIRQ